MKRVDAADFGSEPERIVGAGEIVAVERDGQAVGYYVPAGHPQASWLRRVEAIDRLEAAVLRLQAETGMSEDELVRWFDFSQPVPDLEPRATPVMAGSTAAGR